MMSRLLCRGILQTVTCILVSLVLFAPFATAQLGDPAAPSSNIKDTTRILFIGNSFTYFYNLPEIIAKLADASQQGKVEYQMVAPGGWCLKDHWDSVTTLNALHGHHWDYVVLQDQSTLGITYYLQGQRRVTSDSLFRPHAHKWAAEIQKVGAVPVFYLTWARKATPEDQAALNYAYIDAARESRSVVAPVGIAWKYALQDAQDLKLYDEDGAHPSSVGSYLAACVLFATIFGKDPRGLPEEIIGIPVNLETEKAEPEKKEQLVNVSPEEARTIQALAWRAVQRFLPRGTYPDVSRIPIPTLPPLPPGGTIRVEEIEGTWTGPIRFFPDMSADMTLTLHRSDSAWSGHVAFAFNSKDVKDEAIDLSDLVVGDQSLTFVAAKSVAADSLDIRFRAVITRDGNMQGIADASSSASSGPPTYLLGTLQLSRK